MAAKDNGVYKYLDCSTSHITENDDGLLRIRKDTDLILDKYQTVPNEYGYWIHVPQTKDDIKNMDQPETIKQILLLALKNKCNWVKLDRDGFEHPSLSKYDW